jgi:hypothetical protein
MTPTRFCEQCGASLSPTARFCANCGFSLTGAAPASVGTSAPTAAGATGSAARADLSRSLIWLVPLIAVIGVLGYAFGSRSSGAVAAGTPLGAMGGTAGTAPDISSLSPDERVDRLFNRVMAASSAGKTDTVMFFAPMAVSSFAALEPLTLHRHYDLGLVLMVSGQETAAQAQADTILKAAPNHLLGIVLAMRIAMKEGNTAAAQRLAARLKQVVTAERAKDLPEYRDHATDIDVALAEADLRAKGTAPTAAKKP